MFIGLLLRAMKSDVNLKRVAAFAKRVMQVLINCILTLPFPHPRCQKKKKGRIVFLLNGGFISLFSTLK